MTREEAIYRLKNMAWLYGSAEREQNIEAIDMAIEALSEQKTIIGIDIPYGSDKGIATIFKGDEKMVLEEVKEIMSVVRCKDCLHRHDESCPMFHMDWFTVDEGDGFYSDDYRIIDNTKDDDYCSRGERAEQTEEKNRTLGRRFAKGGGDNIKTAKAIKEDGRPHGEWIWRTDIPIGDGRTSAGYICSNCGKDYWHGHLYDICPNCGAIMKDGDADG